MKKTLKLLTVETNTTISRMEVTMDIVEKTHNLNILAADTTMVAEEASLHALRMMTAVTKNAADLKVGEEDLQAVDPKVALLQVVVAHGKPLSMTTEILTQIPLPKSISQP